MNNINFYEICLEIETLIDQIKTITNNEIKPIQDKIGQLEKEKQKICPHLYIDYTSEDSWKDNYFPAILECQQCGLAIKVKPEEDTIKDYNKPDEEIRELFLKLLYQ